MSDERIIPYGILPDWAIRRYVKIEPFAEQAERPGKISYGLSSYGYDVRLGRDFRIFAPLPGVEFVDPKAMSRDSHFKRLIASECTIPPHGFVLAETLEWLEIPRDVVCICLGKSTYARCGLIANVTPLEPEWRGKITIEISNTTSLPATIYAEEGIVQVLLLRGAPCDVSYADKRGKYQNQPGVTGAIVR